MLEKLRLVPVISMSAPTNLTDLLLSDKEPDYFTNLPAQPAISNTPPYQRTQSEQFNTKLNQVCGLLLQLTEEQRETNLLLRKLINEDNPGHYKLVQLSNQEKYVRYLVVLENDRSRPRMNCPICEEDVEITTAKRGGCKQQSFCGDYVVCNECTNDALQKIMRCPACCETYSNIPVPLCSHLAAVADSDAHLARKGSGNGCPVCNSKLVKEKCSHKCPRKELANYNMAKTILSERVFVLVKNPEACSDEEDRPCSHYCRCTKHNILFTNRNKGAKCRECTKESTKQRQLGKRKRKNDTSQSPEPCALSVTPPPSAPQDVKRFCTPNSYSPYVDMPPQSVAPQQLHPQQLRQMQAVRQQQIQQQLQQQQLQQQMQAAQQQGDPFFSPEQLHLSQEDMNNFTANNNSWLPNFNVRELGKKVYLDDLFKLTNQIPYSEGVVQFAKRVTNNLSNTLGFTHQDESQPPNSSNQQTNQTHPPNSQQPPRSSPR